MEKLHVLRTKAEMEALAEYLQDKDIIAFDTETTGVDRESSIIGFSVCADVEEAFYVILSYWDKEAQTLVDLETKEWAKAFMELLQHKQLIMHNAVFDCMIVNSNYGVELMPSVHTDTMILAHLVDENRQVGLKELGVSMFGEGARAEQAAMKASIEANGGQCTKACYELYKADAQLIAEYGAKDTILTLKILYVLVEQLYEQGLEKFFYDEESMPLLRGPTYDMNTTGLRVDQDQLVRTKAEIEAFCHEAKAFIYAEITPLVKDKYPGTSLKNTFNIGAPKQLSWLVYDRLDNRFHLLTEEGRDLCKFLGIKLPYTNAAKDDFVKRCKEAHGRVWKQGTLNPATGRKNGEKKVNDYWHYLACGKESLGKIAHKYKWIAKLLEYAKNQKLLNTYVIGIQDRMKYNIIRPSFLQHGTTSGRYSSRNPNFQNLPREDKRVKACITARPGNIFVGADYAQLEPRVFASFAQDTRLMRCFSDGDDFYSVIGMEVFEKYDCTLKKDDKDSFAKKYPDLRQIAKVIALAATYGTTAPRMAPMLNKSLDETQEIIDSYFEKFQSVQNLQLSSHKDAMKDGFVTNLYGRKRRMPVAQQFPQIYGTTKHSRLPYEARNVLNLAINHRIQSTGASIMNRAAIACWKACKALAAKDSAWNGVKIVMQVHDELILEGPAHLESEMIQVLKNSMENTITLPGVALLAEPKAAKNLALLK